MRKNQVDEKLETSGNNFAYFINKYEVYLKSRNVADNTLDSYISDINQLCLYCKELKIDRLEDVSREGIENFLMSLYDKNLEKRSICRKISSLKMFFNYLFLFDYIPDNPITRIKRPKLSRRMPKFFTKKQIDVMYNNIPSSNNIKIIRDKAILELLYSSGLRVSELVNLEYNNIDFSEKKIIIIGKGNKKRIVPITNIAKKCMINYSSKIENHRAYKYFFLTGKFQQLHRNDIYKTVKLYTSKITTEKGFSTHSIRHTFASHLLDAGADLYAIKDMLGHSKLGTTEIYTHINPVTVREELLRGHPRADKGKD
jgi:site-specific recombinase XerD